MNIDLIPNGAIKRVHVSQNDVGRTLTFELFNNSTSYTVPSGAVVKIQGTKPSGFGFSEVCSVSGNVATIDTTEAMTDESGNIQTELSISYGDVVIGTSNFVLAVEKNPHPDTTTDGSMETIIPELTLLVNEVKGYAEEIEGTYHAYGSPWVASTVAQMTDTDKIYVYTGSETGYTNGNWYYYNGTSWVSGGVYNAVAVNIDDTLTIQGACADAKAVGDEISDLKGDLSDVNDVVFETEYNQIDTDDFVLMHINTAGLLQYNNNKNAVNQTSIRVLKDSLISVDDGYKFQLGLYDYDTDVFVQRVAWMTNPYVFEGNYRIRIEISDISESVLQDTSITEHLHCTLIKSRDSRLDNKHITFSERGKSIKLAYPIGSVIDLTPESSRDYEYAILNCVEGDIFTISAQGGANPRLWGFLDADNKLLSVSDAGVIETNLILIAPSEASKLVLNNKVSDTTANCIAYTAWNKNKYYLDELKSEFPVFKDSQVDFIKHQNIKLAYPIGSVIDLTPESIGSYSYAIVDCSENDAFLITAEGGVNPRTWGFIDADNKLLSISGAGEILNNTYLVAPSGASKLIINARIDDGRTPSCTAFTSWNSNRYLIKVIQNQIASEEKLFAEKQQVNDSILQLSNIVDVLGTNVFKNKVLQITHPNKYSAWPFVTEAHDKLVCIYSRGLTHTDNLTPTLYSKTSLDGIVWSIEEEIVNDLNTRDTVTGIGNNSDGDVIFWNRVGAPSSNSEFVLYKTADGVNVEKVASPAFSEIGHIGDIITVETVGLMAFYNNYGDTRSWGIVTSSDNGETWTQTVIGSNLESYDCPVEMSGAYLGDGKILVMGRKDVAGGDTPYEMFQIESDDYGQTWAKKYANISDINSSTPSVIYDPNTDKLDLYYYNRGNGKLQHRSTLGDTVWNNERSWADAVTVTTMGTGQDSGNVNACAFNNMQVVSFYSGNATDTGIYDALI